MKTKHAPIQVNTRQMDRELRRLEKKVKRLSDTAIPIATQRSLNKTASKARTQVTRRLAKAKGVPQKVLRKVIKDFKASRKILISKVWIGLKRGIPFEDLTRAASKRNLSKPFRARFKNGKVSEAARRILPSQRAGSGRDPDSLNLPIDYKVRLNPEARVITKAEATKAGRTVMKSEYTRQLRLALQKLSVAQ